MPAGHKQERSQTDEQHQADLDHRQRGGDRSGHRDREAVERREDGDYDDRDYLQACDLEGDPGDARAEQDMTKSAVEIVVERDREHNRDRRLRTGPGDEQLHPAEQEAGQPSIRIPQERIGARGLRLHGRKLRVGQCAGQRKQTGGDPGQQDPARLTHVTGHHARFQEDTCTDDVANYDGDRSDQAETPDKLLSFVYVGIHRPAPSYAKRLVK